MNINNELVDNTTCYNSYSESSVKQQSDTNNSYKTVVSTPKNDLSTLSYSTGKMKSDKKVIQLLLQWVLNMLQTHN